MEYREMIFREIKNYARFKRNAIKYSDPVDIFHMMRCVQVCQICFDGLARFKELDSEEYDHIHNLLEKMSDKCFEVSVQLRSSIWDLLRHEETLEEKLLDHERRL